MTILTFPLGSTDSPEPETVPLHAWREATFRKTFALRYDDGVTARDLSGYTGRLDVTDPTSDLVMESLTTENDGLSIDAVLGTVTVVLSSVETAAATWTLGRYDLFLINTDVELVARGSFALQGP